jgi:hypothetical protein
MTALKMRMVTVRQQASLTGTELGASSRKPVKNQKE